MNYDQGNNDDEMHRVWKALLGTGHRIVRFNTKPTSPLSEVWECQDSSVKAI